MQEEKKVNHEHHHEHHDHEGCGCGHDHEPVSYTHLTLPTT